VLVKYYILFLGQVKHYILTLIREKPILIVKRQSGARGENLALGGEDFVTDIMNAIMILVKDL